MKEIKIGFLGFGNIGTGVYKILAENGKVIGKSEGLDIKVEKVLVRDTGKKRDIPLETSVFTTRIEDIINNPEISVVAEFMGGEEPARQYILAALENKKTVVTANKEVVARHWQEFEQAARKNGVGLYYEASVAGGIPIIKVMGESLQANKINSIIGIINGTTNYILTKMSEEGQDFDAVLKEAQRLGYAEPDPTADIEAFDAVYKLSILSSLSFHTRVHIENIYREGITGLKKDDIEFGRELGYVLKLLAIGKRKGSVVETRVHPTFIPKNHPLASVRDSFNAVFINGDAVGSLMLYGRGAGDLPTGSAVVSDIITACQRGGKHKYAVFNKSEAEAQDVVFNDNWESGFFIRLTVKDKPGVLAKIAGIFGNHEVSIASVIQKDKNQDEVPLIFVTHAAKKLSMNAAMEQIGSMGDVINIDNVIHVENRI